MRYARIPDLFLLDDYMLHALLLNGQPTSTLLRLRELLRTDWCVPGPTFATLKVTYL